MDFSSLASLFNNGGSSSPFLSNLMQLFQQPGATSGLMSGNMGSSLGNAPAGLFSGTNPTAAMTSYGPMGGGISGQANGQQLPTFSLSGQAPGWMPNQSQGMPAGLMQAFQGIQGQNQQNQQQIQNSLNMQQQQALQYQQQLRQRMAMLGNRNGY